MRFCASSRLRSRFLRVSASGLRRVLKPFTLKGISRSIVPYVVEAAESKEEKVEQHVITEHSPGIDLFLDVGAVTSASSERIARVLESALAAVRNTGSPLPVRRSATNRSPGRA